MDKEPITKTRKCQVCKKNRNQHEIIKDNRYFKKVTDVCGDCLLKIEQRDYKWLKDNEVLELLEEQTLTFVTKEDWCRKDLCGNINQVLKNTKKYK